MTKQNGPQRRTVNNGETIEPGGELEPLRVSVTCDDYITDEELKTLFGMSAHDIARMKRASVTSAS